MKVSGRGVSDCEAQEACGSRRLMVSEYQVYCPYKLSGFKCCEVRKGWASLCYESQGFVKFRVRWDCVL